MPGFFFAIAPAYECRGAILLVTSYFFQPHLYESYFKVFWLQLKLDAFQGSRTDAEMIEISGNIYPVLSCA